MFSGLVLYVVFQHHFIGKMYQIKKCFSGDYNIDRLYLFKLESSQVNPLYFHACIASFLSGHNFMDLPTMFGSRCP